MGMTETEPQDGATSVSPADPEKGQAGTASSETKTSQVISYREEFFGPIPHPQLLRQYEELQPGFAERIMRMGEHEQSHRHWVDEQNAKNQEALTSAMVQQAKSEVSMTKIGQLLVFIVILLFFGAAVYFAIAGYPQLIVITFAGLPTASVLMTLYPFRKKTKSDTEK